VADVSKLPGLAELWTRTLGDERICVAVVDGPVDLGHPSLADARLVRAEGIWSPEGLDGPKARHGTHVASIIFGQHSGPVRGVAPGCSGVSVAAFSDRRRTSQLDLARAIELAVESGAHIVNISGGEISATGEAEDFLDRAVRLCRERNVLVVAAAGNDGCSCDAVPAALPTALAVGALDDAGEPLKFSNWGPGYRDHGILAPGENIRGAVPGGVTTSSGTSAATPIVAGVAALLLSMQVQSGAEPDPMGVRDVLLASVDPCELEDPQACGRFLSGKLNIRRTMSAVTSDMTLQDREPAHACACGGHGKAACTCGDHETPGTAPHACTCGGASPAAHATPSADDLAAGALVAAGAGSLPMTTSAVEARDAGPPPPTPSGRYAGVADRSPSEVVLSQQQQAWAPYVYALGTLGYDFGTEARRDTFKQLMPPATIDGTVVPANPYDARQMVDHLRANPSEAKALIWTLNLELTPIYAIEPVGPYAASVYELLARLLAGEILGEDDPGFIRRVSIPGRLEDRHVKLFSGQEVPVVETEQTRGLYGWETNRLIPAATAAAQLIADAPEARVIEDALRDFLARVYYDLRNLGNTSRDRALNFAATNAFQAAHTFAAAIGAGMALDTIGVEKSPFCRMDSDCWDVKLHFFDPENSRRARKVFRFTIDVSDILPVTLGEVRSWSEAG
jgi:cyanobactin maturation PatA/PatG family protease